MRKHWEEGDCPEILSNWEITMAWRLPWNRQAFCSGNREGRSYPHTRIYACANDHTIVQSIFQFLHWSSIIVRLCVIVCRSVPLRIFDKSCSVVKGATTSKNVKTDDLKLSERHCQSFECLSTTLWPRPLNWLDKCHGTSYLRGVFVGPHITTITPDFQWEIYSSPKRKLQ